MRSRPQAPAGHREPGRQKITCRLQMSSPSPGHTPSHPSYAAATSSPPSQRHETSRLVQTVTAVSTSNRWRTGLSSVFRRSTRDRSEGEPIVAVPLTAGSVFAERNRRERRIAHGERKWSYLALEMKARGRRRVTRAVMEPGPDSTASQREVEMMGKAGQRDYVMVASR